MLDQFGPDRLKHRQRAVHVGLNEHLRSKDGAVHVRLRQQSGRLRRPACSRFIEYRMDQLEVANITMDEGMTLLAALSEPLFDVRETLKIPRVGEEVEVSDHDSGVVV